MPNTVISGMQWGDEGKGKIVDLLCPAYDAVVRYQGGDNAGHTVKFGDRHFALHLVPSGIVRPGVRCVLGNGMVINPETLFRELDGLRKAGVDPAGRLFISDRAHLNLPLYGALDQAREEAKGDRAIGTTARGIGPAYEMKAWRGGLRLRDLFASNLERRVRTLLLRVEREIQSLGGEPLGHPGQLVDLCHRWRQELRPFLRDTAVLLNGWIDQGRELLFEGAQGALLDLDHGTYPFVTSSNPTAGGAATGTGVPPTRIGGVIGVLKAYTTRVGGGPFVTELEGAGGEYLRKRGNEYGTTTGRPRRCGWLDLVAARYARMLSGVDVVALTKLDVLDQLDEVRLCVAYRIGGQETRDFPSSLDDLEQAEPVYRTLPGWQADTVGRLDFDELPERARTYVAAIEEELGAPIGLVSTGPRREETILRPVDALRRLSGDRLHRVLAQQVAG